MANPFLSENTIIKAVKQYNTKKLPVFSANLIKSRLYDQNIYPINHDIKHLIQTQDLPPIYEENSCFYIFKKAEFLVNKSRIFKNSLPYVINKIESIDIDTEEDWNLAETISKGIF